jgi:hypothetical protein
LCPIGSLSGCVTAERFHSVPWWANGNWCPLFHFLPVSYVIWNFWPAKYSACHLLSRWYLAPHIQPWRRRRYVPPKHWSTFNELHGVIS